MILLLKLFFELGIGGATQKSLPVNHNLNLINSRVHQRTRASIVLGIVGFVESEQIGMVKN